MRTQDTRTESEMTHQIRMWEVTDGNTPTEIRRDEINLEKRLQDWLEQDISMLDPDLLVIGREVLTAYGGKIDLLCLDSSGGLVVVELKKGRTPREVTAQALDYAYWVRDLSYDEIAALYDDYRKSGQGLSAAFEQKYGDELPATLNESHRSVIVAEEWESGRPQVRLPAGVSGCAGRGWCTRARRARSSAGRRGWRRCPARRGWGGCAGSWRR